MNTLSIDSPRLAAFAGSVLTATGLSSDDASLVADTLVKADLWGHQSHGVMRLSWYVARLRTGVMNKETKIT
jgi:LDH2 family malate/lactate/ureidoglycolate dehydrogenase